VCACIRVGNAVGVGFVPARDVVGLWWPLMGPSENSPPGERPGRRFSCGGAGALRFRFDGADGRDGECPMQGVR